MDALRATCNGFEKWLLLIKKFKEGIISNLKDHDLNTVNIFIYIFQATAIFVPYILI